MSEKSPLCWLKSVGKHLNSRVELQTSNGSTENQFFFVFCFGGWTIVIFRYEPRSIIGNSFIFYLNVYVNVKIITKHTIIRTVKIASRHWRIRDRRQWRSRPGTVQLVRLQRLSCIIAHILYGNAGGEKPVHFALACSGVVMLTRTRGSAVAVGSNE